jgi:divalent metal cation (Fe/Co/Zn/Cd) transporter
MVIFGQVVWSGWPMVAMLLASVVPPLILGRAKSKLAPRLHDKTLKADADMNRADWQTALAGIVGIVGIGHGLWWADGAAGVLISASIVKDGVQNLRSVVANLMDSRPLTVEGPPSEVPEKVRAALLALPWVLDAEVRMREEGHTFCGELFLKVSETRDLSSRLAEARRTASAVDWRVHDVVIELEEELPDRGASREAAEGRAGDPRPLPGS